MKRFVGMFGISPSGSASGFLPLHAEARQRYPVDSAGGARLHDVVRDAAAAIESPGLLPRGCRRQPGARERRPLCVPTSAPTRLPETGRVGSRPPCGSLLPERSEASRPVDAFSRGAETSRAPPHLSNREVRRGMRSAS